MAPCATTPPVISRGKALRLISRKEVAEHNSDKSCWLVIDNLVYDVTSWIKSHPGGPEIILGRAGTDSSDAFLVWHSERVRENMLKRFVIGKCEEVPSSELRKDFLALNKKFESEGWYTYDSFRAGRALVLIMLLLVASVSCVLAGSCAIVRVLGGSFFLAAFWQQMAFMGHDTGHGVSISSKKWNQWLCLLVGPFTTGVSTAWWKCNHNVHHAMCNSTTHDPDIQHLPVFAISTSFFKGLYSNYYKRSMPLDRFARFMVSHQYFFFCPVMMLARFNLIALGWIHVLTNKSIRNRAYEVVSMLGFFVGFFLLISQLHSAWEMAAFFWLSMTMPGILHFQITLSHFAMPTFEGPTFDASGGEDWVRHQASTTLDIECNTVGRVFHGGLECQLEHHLFPRLPRHRLHDAIPLVQQMLKQHKVLRHTSTFFGALGVTLRRLREVSKQVPPGEGTKTLTNSFLWRLMSANG